MGITITQPKSGQTVRLGETVEFAGTVALGTRSVELVADGTFEFPPVTLENNRTWFVGNRFNAVGTREITARALDRDGIQIGDARVEIVVVEPQPVEPMARAHAFGDLVPIPANINKGVSAAKQKTMLEIFGRPCSLSADCTAVTNAKVKALLETADVGPFKVTGIKPVVEALTRIFARVKKDEPELFKAVGTAGVLCCRRVRRPPGQSPSPNFSNHSWGTAIDLTIKGRLDPRGDGRTQFGILLLAPYFNEERFFWGAGFKGASEDAMHFEASDELVRDWQNDGVLG
ncbi:M15 family metallopeptidase [Longimicrobium sp.]|uniref:M15 family metallopeptidase n=1 Tax=Longimicrobium sp. TaxID=2029185 RepID=UPI002E2F6384|nr:M15 family metallopeptidase [Longimicrobium sp.]HEX6038422.1 M15 family metallopeptidase [Longimicrobium sp.]